MKNAYIHAPPAEWVFGLPKPSDLGKELEPPSPEEVIQAQDVEIRRLMVELERLRATAHTIANTAAALSYLAQRPDSEWVTVPKDVHTRMRDVKLSVRETDEGTQVRWVTRAPDHVWEGRHD